MYAKRGQLAHHLKTPPSAVKSRLTSATMNAQTLCHRLESPTLFLSFYLDPHQRFSAGTNTYEGIGVRGVNRLGTG